MKLSRKLPLLCCALALAASAAGLWGIQRLSQAIGVYEHTLRDEIAQERAVADLQLHFKVQVQEWKNVLLRGKDEAARAKYWAAFGKEEQAVKRGQKIAEMGSTDAERVQLHFEIRKQGKPIDPAKLLPPR